MSTATVAVTNHETYNSEGIPSPASLDSNPLTQFSKWFKDAQGICPEPEAVAISTVDNREGKAIPSTRFVLLKAVDDKGFIFYTNYESRKGKELGLSAAQVTSTGQGNYASMAFYFREQHRSIRIVGRAEKITEKETKDYFNGRPVGSRIGAWSSPQSTVLSGREELESLVVKTEEKFNVKKDAEGVELEQEVPVPDFWGGVRLVPFEVEFWMGRPSRLHDRVKFTRSEGSVEPWTTVRLAP